MYDAIGTHGGPYEVVIEYEDGGQRPLHYRLTPLTTKSASRSRPLMLTSARRMTQAHLAVGLARLDHRLGTREGHARPWKRTRLCSSIDIGRLLVPSGRSGDPADP